MKKPPAPPPLRIMVSRKDAAKAISVSLVTLDALIKSGALKAKRLGGRVLIPVAEIERYVAGLEDAEKQNPPASPAGGLDNVEPIRPRGAAPEPADHNSSPSRA